jgi:hypothetical protein
MNKLDGTYKTVYDVGIDGRLLPRSARGKKIRGRLAIKDEGAVTGGTAARSFLVGEHDQESVSVWCSREDEKRLIDEFVMKVGVTTCPSGVSRGALPKHDKPKITGVQKVINIKTKRFRMDGDLISPKIERRVMASEHRVCPVCDRLFPRPTKAKCPDCGHDMKKKQATSKEVKEWLEKIGTVPINLMTYRGFNYEDLRRFALDASIYRTSYGDVVRAFNRLFGMKMQMKGGEDWMRLMVGYELQRRIIYPRGEPERVKQRRQQLRKGIIPADLKELIDAKNKKEEKEKETIMAKKEKKKVTKKKTSHQNGDDRRTIDCMGYPVTHVIRWFGKNGYSTSQCLYVMEKLGVTVKRGSVNCSIKIGRDGHFQGRPLAPAPLTDAEVKTIKKYLAELGDAGLPGKAKSKKEVKKASKKTTKAKPKQTKTKKAAPLKKKLPPKKRAKK